MKTTFGICVSPTFNQAYLTNLLWSIYDAMHKRDDYEIILIGQNILDLKNSIVRVIDFPEDAHKPGWITKKKNVLANAAKYDNLVLLHDYYELDGNWGAGYNKYDEDWDIMLNRINTAEGTRHSDWLVNPNRMNEALNDNLYDYTKLLMSAAPHENHAKYVSGLPYDVNDLTHIQYISGGYVVCKRHVLENVPMNEELVWGQAEDVEWSERLNAAGYLMRFNNKISATTQKPGKWKLYQMPDEFVDILRRKYGSRV